MDVIKILLLLFKIFNRVLLLLPTGARHFVLSIAACSHYFWQMLKAFSDTLRASLEHFFWHSGERLPCLSSPNRSFLGSRWCGIQTTWPAQRNWVSFRIVWIWEGWLGWAPLCLGSCLAILCQVGSSDWCCGIGWSSWHGVGRPSTNHSHRAQW